MSIVRTLALLLAALVAIATPAAAQNVSSSSIDGIVTDQSGGALPGVTVTVTSPALQVQQLSDRRQRPAFASAPVSDDPTRAVWLAA